MAHHASTDTEADRRGLGDLLRQDFIDVPGVERDALWTADATTGPVGQRFTLDQCVAEVVNRYGAGSIVADCMLQIEGALRSAIERTYARMRAPAASSG